MSIHSIPGSVNIPAPPLTPPAYPLLGPQSDTVLNTFHQIMLVKGAPDILLQKCSHFLDEDGTQQLINEKFLNAVNVNITDFATQVSCSL